MGGLKTEDMPMLPTSMTGFHGLSENQKNQMHDIFALLDSNVDGLIGIEEVMFALQGATGGPIDETEVREWLQRISTDPNGEIDVYDLVQIIAAFDGPPHFRTAKAKAKALEQAFGLVDVAGSGKLSAEGLQMAAARLNAKWSIAEAQQVLQTCDVDGNGVCDVEDFKKLMGAAWEQPQERWADIEIETASRLAVRQAEIDRLTASIKKLTTREEDDATPVDEEAVDAIKVELEPIQRAAEIEDLEIALKHMPDGEKRVESEARLAELHRITQEKADEVAAAAAAEAAGEAAEQ